MSKVVSLEGLSRFWKNVNDKKQDKLVDGVNIATINGQSLTEGGDLTIEGGAKVYELDLTGRGNFEGYITEEEWNIIKTSDRIKIITDTFSTEIVQLYSPFLELNGDIAAFCSMMGIQGGVVTQYMFTGANATEGSPYSYQIAEVHILDKTSQLENDSNFITPEDVAGVALSGSYNDLHDAPTIPSAVTESTVSGWGFTKNTGTYSKPSTGIPKTDLASAVQTSLGKADTAIQSTSFGELTDLAVVKGFESAQNGTVYALPDCDTGDEDDVLLSRSSVKTINGQSIVGRGDIEIGGGGSGGEDIRYFTEFTVEQVVAAGYMLELSNGTSELYAAAENNKLICIPCQDGLNGFIVASYEVTLDESLYVSFIYGAVYYLMTVTPFMLDISKQPLLTHTVFVDSGSIDVYDNTNYVVTAPVTQVAVWPMDTLNVGSTIRFTTGEDCSISISGNVKWVNGVIPTIESGVTYELSIIKQRIAGSFTVLAVLAPFKPVE